MAWSWMVVGSGWTFPSLNDLTPQPLESTWAGPHMVEVAQVVHDAVHVTTTVDMTVGMIEVVMTATRTGTTIDHTEGDLHHHTTEELTGLALDHGLTLHVVIEAPPLPKLRAEVFLIGMIVCRIDLFSLKVTPLFTCVCEQLTYLRIGCAAMSVK